MSTPPQASPASENRLAHETSPYLLQHKDNPVAWWAWGPEALAEAKQANKPILLSVGYAACHWCHVMAHESFEDGDTAAVMNESVRQHQSRQRRAARHRSDLHGSAASSWRAGRLAAHDVSDALWRADLGRHLFSQNPALRQTRFRRCAARDRAYLSRRAGKDRAQPHGINAAAGSRGAARRQRHTRPSRTRQRRPPARRAD